MAMYQVIVGNVGLVVDTDNKAEANVAFRQYVNNSKNNIGMASGETVTLMVDGELDLEHFGDNDRTDYQE